MHILTFFVFATPVLFSVYWLILLFVMLRTHGHTPWLYYVAGVALFALQVALTILYRAEVITSQAAETALGSYLLQTSFYADSLMRVAQTYLVGAIAAGILLLLLLLIRHAMHRLLYDTREAVMLALGGLIAGWPGILIFLFIVFCCVALAAMAHILFARRTLQDRFIIGPVIPLAALCAIWFGPALMTLTNLDVIRF